MSEKSKDDRFDDLRSVLENTSVTEDRKRPTKSEKKGKEKKKNKKKKGKKKEEEEQKRVTPDDLREIQELSERIALLESQGRTDAAIVSELAKRGIPASVLKTALQQHLEEHPDHDLNEESIDAMLADIPSSAENRDPGVAYDIQQATAGRFYTATGESSLVYQGSGLDDRMSISRGSGPAEYRVDLVEEMRREADPMYDKNKALEYQKLNSRIDESIDENIGIKIGGKSLYNRKFFP